MNPTLFIVEGPDCSGKTTLAKYLAKWINDQHDGRHNYKAAYFRCHGTPLLFPAMTDIQQMVIENAEHCIKHLGMSYILDRSWPSEYVYGRIFRPQSTFAHSHFALRCQELGAFYIYCRSDKTMERHKANKDPKHPYDDGAFQKVIDGYDEWYSEWADKCMIYNLEQHGSNLSSFCDNLLLHL